MIGEHQTPKPDISETVSKHLSLDTPELRHQSGPHMFVGCINTPVLDEKDLHHLSRVLRHKLDETLTVSDGCGNWAIAKQKTKDSGAVDLCSQIFREVKSKRPLAIACALTKGDKPETVVQKLTEIGIDEIIIGASRYSVAKWDKKIAKQQARLSLVARAAAMQSKQAFIPNVTVVQDLFSYLGQPHLADKYSNAVRADFGGRALNAEDRLLIIGPEGGWHETERAAHPDSVDLAKNVLRSETAAITAAVMMTHLREATQPAQ